MDIKEIKLTNEQQNIYEKLINYVKSDNNEILFIGYAGTGKTTLITKFINDSIKNKFCNKIAIAAPTHKAVNIAKSKLFDNISLGEELSKNISIMTVHRLLNYQSFINLEGEKYFAKGKVDPIWSIYNLIVVDECSMLSNQIISDIRLQLDNSINSKVKIIYVGDPAQLPPVNQSESKIFNSKIDKLSLETIIRTSNQKIMDLSNDHRKWIFSKKNEDIPNVGIYESDQIKLYSTKQNETINWLNDYISLIKNEVKDACNKDLGSSNNIILTWTNKKCNKYNQYVREKMFNKKDLDYYEIGEILIFNDFHRIIINTVVNKEENKVENKEENINIKKDFISFYTSEQIKLVNLEKVKYKFEKIKFKINNNLTEKLNFKFKKNIILINDLIKEEIDIFKMKVIRTSELNEEIPIIHDIVSIHQDSIKKYNYILEEYENIITTLKNNCYKNISKNKNSTNMTKCNLQTEVENKINRLHKDWQINVIDCFAELNYGYSITVHKSQGSTFKNVFIDISDILDNDKIDETSKCLYTAITRSSDTLKLLI